MDPAAIASQAVSLLTPYVGKAAGKAAEKLGEEMPEAVSKLWRAIHQRFGKKPITREALKDYLEGPEDADTQASLRKELKKLLEGDPSFGAQVWELIRKCEISSNVVVSTGPVAAVQAKESVLAGERGIAGPVQAGIVLTGDHATVVLDQKLLDRLAGRSRRGEDLREATQRYLKCVLDRHLYLDFRGMGVADRVPLRLPLPDLYVPLKARIELPPGETWSRDLTVAGRRVPAEERESLRARLSEPVPLVDLLEKNSGLVMLGDPGAGKTTFLKFLALQYATGRMPESRLPVLVPLSAYANVLSEKDIRLDDFVADYFHDLGADLPIADLLSEAMEAGTAIVMLDGLDEVRDIGLRDTVVGRVVDFYTFHRGKGQGRAENKFLLTSRIVGYREVRRAVEGLTECTLVDLDDQEVEHFVARWTSVLERAARGETPVAEAEATRERGELLEAIRRNPGVRRLAANPLLLTILALMKRQGVTLPERRVELYQKYVETLLSSWNRARGLDRAPARDLDVGETMKVLAPLALWMHETSPGAGLVRQADLKQKLEEVFRDRGEADPERAVARFLSDVHDYAGLLLERGSGQYGFIHLTFEEYLAALALAQKGQQDVTPIVSALSDRVGDPAWREVALLTVGYLGVVQGRDVAAGALVEGLVAADARGETGARGEATILAGEATADVCPGGLPLAVRDRMAQRLLSVMTDDRAVKPPVRARAAGVLARLGDPRFRQDAFFLPDEPLLGFVSVPSGPFLMGRKGNLREMTFPDYYIARYPVTNAQYRAFVAAGGYRVPEYWVGAAQVGVWRDGLVKGRFDSEWRAAPHESVEPFGVGNHPAVGITWYEALAYSRWLTDSLKDWDALPDPLVRLLRMQGMVVTLPSEAQWEKAARGGGRVPSASGDPKLMVNPEPQRSFPWGNAPDPNKGNYDDSEVGTTSGVGCFPGGASPYGCQDMSGNAWEWTRSAWRKDWSSLFDYPDDLADGREDVRVDRGIYRVVRGGAFGDDADGVLCTSRFRVDPELRFRDLGVRLVVSAP